MKILIYTGYRTGSNSFGERLSIELNLPYHHEPFNKIITIPSMVIDKILLEEKISLGKNISIEETEDCIIKVSPSDGFNYEELKKLFDKIIVLYRENTKEQAESMLWANAKQLWHHVRVNDKFISAHYIIPTDWLNINAEEIELWDVKLQKENEILKSLTDCLHITYEELYYSDEGIKKIEDYIGFKSKSKFDKMHKLRNQVYKQGLI